MKEKYKRVVAIRDSNEEVINIYGYGDYVGDYPCPILGGYPNPQINLDNGKTVWGCQCWWGDLEKFEKEMVGDRKVIVVPLEEN